MTAYKRKKFKNTRGSRETAYATLANGDARHARTTQANATRGCGQRRGSFAYGLDGGRRLGVDNDGVDSLTS
jgi:hypothetical protein